MFLCDLSALFIDVRLHFPCELNNVLKLTPQNGNYSNKNVARGEVLVLNQMQLKTFDDLGKILQLRLRPVSLDVHNAVDYFLQRYFNK